MKKILALLLLLPSLAFGQGWQIGNPVGTPRALPTPGTVMTKANVDVYGNQLTGLSNGGVQSANNAVKLEDSVATSGDALVGVAYEARDTLATLEETSDYILPKSDLLGRTITTLAPAGESWSSCSAQITTTSSTQIKAAVPSNRIYVTDISCHNISAVNSAIAFQDGVSGTVLWRGNSGQIANGGGYQHSFSIPLRLTSNTALAVVLGTTATDSICCASGYISVN